MRQIELLEEERKEAHRKRGLKSEVWHVKPRADDRKDPGSSVAPVNMLAPIQAISFSVDV